MSEASESAGDRLSQIDVVTADSNRKKTIKHIAANCRPPSIAQPATTIFNVEATAVDREHGE